MYEGLVGRKEHEGGKRDVGGEVEAVKGRIKGMRGWVRSGVTGVKQRGGRF